MRILTDNLFSTEFERCCREYSMLKICCAWAGKPELTFPYTYLNLDNTSNLKIQILLGYSFDHTHPEAIKYFMNNKCEIRIVRREILFFHPKVYLFTKKNKFALFVGSSNFTYSGFNDNIEINELIEGKLSGNNLNQINILLNKIDHWHTPKNSFIPNKTWLNKYTKDYYRQKAKEKKYGIPTASRDEDTKSPSDWLSRASWKVYYKKILEGLDDKKRDASNYFNIFNTSAKKLKLPLQVSIFDDIENRKIIGGIGQQYGWLGHVGASWRFRDFMVNGDIRNKRKALKAINTIYRLSIPLNIEELKSELITLYSIGPTMKVWSRIFTIIRPDIFCTVASTSLRNNLAETLGIPRNHFETPEGYIKLIELIHSSPWFKSIEPNNKKEVLYWKTRVAFMDAIFY